MLDSYRDVASCYSFNIPAGNAEDYARHAGISANAFKGVIAGLRKLYDRDPEHYDKVVAINVNGADDGPRSAAELKYSLPIGDTDKQVQQLRELLPYSRIDSARPLCDRAGLLSPFAIDNSAHTVRNYWRLPRDAKSAIGCGGALALENPEMTRFFGWLHINSRGQLITCCQDYLEQEIFGDLNTEKLSDLLVSQKRAEAIDHTMRGMCMKCQFAM